MFGIGKKLNAQGIMKEIQAGKAVLMDVRGDDEWHSGHAKGVVHLSGDRVIAGELPTKDTDMKVYLYCASGGRAGTESNVLKEKGFATENIGGLSGWRNAGGAMELSRRYE